MGILLSYLLCRMCPILNIFIKTSILPIKEVMLSGESRHNNITFGDRN